ncbi:hypothetical protein R1sor_007987 [Riccia sorocarpa]|uniref:Endonuclease/exonuclease/phosphatase domain-containing protein n=1 Tax=Riccia sorocarpa TaxID=122646 RepID=A0ABD3HTR3_9MARC
MTLLQASLTGFSKESSASTSSARVANTQSHPQSSTPSASSQPTTSFAIVPFQKKEVPLYPPSPAFPVSSDLFPEAPIITEVCDEVPSAQEHSGPQPVNPTTSSPSIRELLAQRRKGPSGKTTSRRVTKRTSSSDRDSAVGGETHVSADRLNVLVGTFTSEYRVLAADALGQRGGVTILVHSSCKVVEWTAVNHRIVWGSIQTNGLALSVASIYAPIEATDRKLFWRQLMELLPSRKFLFGGDWNVVEAPDDSSSSSNWLSHQESVNFFNFKANFDLLDVRKAGCVLRGPSFTRSQMRDGRMSWAVLDRFYSPVSLLAGFQMTLVHHSEFTTSDHLPASLLFSGERGCRPGPQGSLYFKADPRILKEPELKETINVIWSKHKHEGLLDSPEKFFAAWREIWARLEAIQNHKWRL